MRLPLPTSRLKDAPPVPAIERARPIAALYYAAGLFAVSAIVLGIIYFTLSRSLEVEQTVTSEIGTGATESVDVERETSERRVTEETLDRLRDASLLTFGALLVLSGVAGWVVSGRVLRPVAWSVGLQRRFVQDASHDLRNPLAVMRTTLDVALEDPETSIAQWRKTGRGVVEAVERMSDVVDRLLRVVRDETPATRGTQLDPAPLLASVGRQVEQAASTRRIDVRVTTQPGQVVGNAAAIERAVANVVDNALRYAPADSEVLIDGRANAVTHEYEIRVQDQGPGIPEDKADSVFERGQRSRDSPGLGLGLAVAREVVEAHYGAISVERAGPAGTVFLLRLPTPRDPEGLGVNGRRGRSRG